MKVYLAEHPGKTNKDAMKHVCPPTLSTFLIHDQVFRLARFGKMHRKIQGVARKLRGRTPKLLSGRRKLPTLRVRLPRLSLAATNERSRASGSCFWPILFLARVWTFRYIIVYFNPGFFFALYSIVSSCPSLLLCFLQREDD